MAVRQRRNGHWFVDLRHNRMRYRLLSPENSRRGAQAYEAVLRSKLTQGLPIREPEEVQMTFREFGEYWFATYVKTNNRATTARSRKTTLCMHLYPTIGHLKLKDISALHIEKVKAQKLKEGLSPKTVNNIISTIRVALNSAVDWGHRSSVPRIKWLKTAEKSFNFLNMDECGALLQGAGEGFLHDMLLCAMRTGMRRGELIGLEWPAVDFVGNKITVRQSYVEHKISPTKNNRIRYIPITSDLRDTLCARRSMRGFVFSRNPQKPEEGIAVNKLLYKLCDKVGMRRIGWHVLRHTFASHLVTRNVPIRAVQMLLGHSSIQMTERYAHLAPSTLHDAVSVLDRAWIPETRGFGHHVGTNPISLPAHQTEEL